jgi:hypothetical protein
LWRLLLLLAAILSRRDADDGTCKTTGNLMLEGVNNLVGIGLLHASQTQNWHKLRNYELIMSISFYLQQNNWKSLCLLLKIAVGQW